MIPIARPFLGEEEAQAAREVILSGWVTQGPKVKQFERDFAAFAGSKYACAVSSCTAALHVALMTVGVKPGDAVITVSHSFIATANAIRHCGAEPLFIDIGLDTYNISPKELKRCLGEECSIREEGIFHKGGRRVAAVLPVHQLGMPCDLRKIINIAHEYNLPVVEDAACATGSEINLNGRWEKIGKPHGDTACFSFHPRKVITTGDGGMLTTNNPKYDSRFRLLRHHGMNISDLARHKTKKIVFEKYEITGYNYRMTDIQAAVGIEQLKRIPRMIKERRKLAALYNEKLKKIPWLKTPFEPEYCRTNWQSYPMTVTEHAPLSRDEIMQYLLDKGIATRRGVVNAHQEKPYQPGPPLPNSECARDSVIMLPLFNGMKSRDLDEVVNIMKNL